MQTHHIGAFASGYKEAFWRPSVLTNVPEIIAMAFPILWLSRIGAGVRCLSHSTFVYCTGRQTGEPGRLDWGKAQTINKNHSGSTKKALPIKTENHLDAGSCFKKLLICIRMYCSITINWVATLPILLLNWLHDSHSVQLSFYWEHSVQHFSW